jgi:3-oxoadipate CoA-transferase alpha subunit
VNKVATDIPSAVADVGDGASILVGGFGGAGAPTALLEELAGRDLHDLTVIANNAGTGTTGLAALLASGAASRIICSYPRMRGSEIFEKLYSEGSIELELCPQGTLSERIRAAGAGIAGFYTRVAADTDLAAGRETRVIDGRLHVLETPLAADFALIRADTADRWGNLTYRKAARNFGPTMAMAGRVTVAETDRIVPLGDIDPELVVTPGIFVQRVVEVPS